MSHTINLAHYFARIGYAGPREATLEVLQEIHRLHPAAIPFENLAPLTRQAVKLAPSAGGDYWNTLGVALYRTGDWNAAVTALEKSMECSQGGDAFDWFFLSRAHWQRGDRKQARHWYDKAVPWTEKNRPRDDDLCRFRAEAEALLGAQGPLAPQGPEGKSRK